MENGMVKNYTPEENIYIKFAFDAGEINESDFATIYRMNQFYTVPNGRFVMEFQYKDLRDQPDIADDFGIAHNENTVSEHITEQIDWYMQTDDKERFSRILNKAASVTESGEEPIEKLGTGIRLPEIKKLGIQYPEEYLQLELSEIISDKSLDRIQLKFLNTSIIRKSDRPARRADQLAQQDDIQHIHKQMKNIVSQLMEITNENPDPILLANTPEEMMRKMLGVSDLGDGFTEEVVNEEISIEMRIKDAQRLVQSIRSQKSVMNKKTKKKKKIFD